MNVHFRQANPRAGNESFLLRFEETGRREDPCLLVDAGQNVDVNELLDNDEYLGAILLTHAHADHYQSLGENLRDGAPIYTSPATASILETVLNGANRGGLNIDTDAVIDRVEPTAEGTDVTDTIRVRPIPAGHTPGAVGFVISFEDGDETNYIVTTGDFTRRRAAGYPGFDLDLPIDVGAVFLTAANRSDFSAELTEAIGAIVEQARAGSRVLVTASGLTGVHCAYLLANLEERFDPPRVVLAGQVAKLLEALDYELDGVETVPEFDDPEELLSAETVTIAGPEVPMIDTMGKRRSFSAESTPTTSSGRLFGTIHDDPTATLIQLISGTHTPIDTADCTVNSYSLVNHPAETDVRAVVDSFEPQTVVIEHQAGEAAKWYRDEFPCIVWAIDDTTEHTIYDGDWRTPHWMTDEGQRLARTQSSSSRSLIDIEGVEEWTVLPSISRTDEVDLNSEGLDLGQLAERLRVSESLGDPPKPSSPTLTASRSNQRASMDTERVESDDREDGTDPEIVPGSETTSVSSEDEHTFEAVLQRLDTIEDRLNQSTGRTVSARAIDAGGGVTLLRLFGDAGLAPGETIAVTLPATESGASDADRHDADG